MCITAFVSNSYGYCLRFTSCFVCTTIDVIKILLAQFARKILQCNVRTLCCIVYNRITHKCTICLNILTLGSQITNLVLTLYESCVDDLLTVVVIT